MKSKFLREQGSRIALLALALLPPSMASAAPTDGRLLASQCFQCHGTNGQSNNGFDNIAGKTDILGELREMQRSTKNDIMHNQAKGYTDVQLQAIAIYLAGLPGGGGGD
jgi:cytochrome c553